MFKFAVEICYYHTTYSHRNIILSSLIKKKICGFNSDTIILLSKIRLNGEYGANRTHDSFVLITLLFVCVIKYNRQLIFSINLNRRKSQICTRFLTDDKKRSHYPPF